MESIFFEVQCDVGGTYRTLGIDGYRHQKFLVRSSTTLLQEVALPAILCSCTGRAGSRKLEKTQTCTHSESDIHGLGYLFDCKKMLAETLFITMCIVCKTSLYYRSPHTNFIQLPNSLRYILHSLQVKSRFSFHIVFHMLPDSRLVSQPAPSAEYRKAEVHQFCTLSSFSKSSSMTRL